MPRSVLIIDAISTRRIHLRAQLDTTAYPVDLAETQSEGLARARKDPPDVVIIAGDLPDLRLRQFCKTLRSQKQTQFTTVVVAVQSENQSARVSALVDGAHDVIDMKSDGVDLKARMRSFMRSRDYLSAMGQSAHGNIPQGLSESRPDFAPRTTVTLVSQTPDTDLFRSLLERSADAGIDARHAPMHTVRRDPDGENDVYILFETGPDDGVRDTLIALRSHPASRKSRILFVTDCTSLAASPLDLGADDQVPMAISPSELTLRITRLARGKRDADRKTAETKELAQKAYVDGLTGLHNRTAMEEYLVRMDRTLADQPKAIAVMIADLDHFKTINDSHGHAAGDMILAKVAQTLKSKLRDGDFIARYGGEEFLIVLTNVKRDHARDVAMRLRDAVADTPIALTSGTVLRATISIGLAVAQKTDRMTTRELQRAADNALYSAKRSGRNRIELAQIVSPLGRPLGGFRAEL